MFKLRQKSHKVRVSDNITREVITLINISITTEHKWNVRTVWFKQTNYHFKVFINSVSTCTSLHENHYFESISTVVDS